MESSGTVTGMHTLSEGRKRAREDDGVLQILDAPSEKRIRPTIESPDRAFYHDSVLNTPVSISQPREQSKYDSDEESTSMVSEPGSPQDASMSSDDEADMGRASFSHSPEDFTPRAKASTSNPWGVRLQTDRIPTPMVSARPGDRPLQARTGAKTHVRQRHPPETASSDPLLDIPSPIDEDEVPTPPSAAEAAGSQFSMLTVSDIDMEATNPVPTISIDLAQPIGMENGHDVYDGDLESTPDMEPMETGTEAIVLPKRRRRSGALSSGNSPVRAGPSTTGNRRGFSVGFRADCEKCQMRVPGHLNHFIV